MSDSDNDEYYWYSEPEDEDEQEEEEIWYSGDTTGRNEWTQSIHQESNIRGQSNPDGYLNEFEQFTSWRYGMPSPFPVVSPCPNSKGQQQPSDKNYAELRRRKFLCLHYFSNMLGFSFDDQNEDVYPLDSIKEWNDLKDFTTWGDILKDHIQNGKTLRSFYLRCR